MTGTVYNGMHMVLPGEVKKSGAEDSLPLNIPYKEGEQGNNGS